MAQLTTASFLDKSLSEIGAVFNGYRILLGPGLTAIARGLQERYDKALADLTERYQTITQKLKISEETIMELQSKGVEKDKKIKDLTEERKMFWAGKERAAHKRKFGMTEHDEGYSDEVHEDADSGLKYKRQHKRSVQTGRRSDDETLMKVFKEVNSLVKENPKCTGDTPIGIAFDRIRLLIKNKGGNNTVFLISILESAREMVTEITLDSSKGIGWSFRRIRRLLRD